MQGVIDGFNSNISQAVHSERIAAMFFELNKLSETISWKLGEHLVSGFIDLAQEKDISFSFDRMNDSNKNLIRRKDTEPSYYVGGFLNFSRSEEQQTARQLGILGTSKMSEFSQSNQTKGGMIDEREPEKSSEKLNKSHAEKLAKNRKQSQDSSKGK
ncbi:MAG: hypothetical protein ACRY3E_04760 [Candidatus Lariskella arthropodorum]